MKQRMSSRWCPDNSVHLRVAASVVSAELSASLFLAPDPFSFPPEAAV